MDNPTSDQAFKIADFFHQLGIAIGDYIESNKNSLNKDDVNTLFDQQVEILRLSGKINTYGVTLVFNDVEDTINSLQTITDKVKATIHQLQSIQQAITIATTLTDVGSAILLKNPQLIADRIKKSVNLFGMNTDKTLPGKG